MGRAPSKDTDNTVADEDLSRVLVGGETRVVAVLGNPVRHSLSPRMHNAAFRHLGLDYVYTAFDPKPHRLKDAIRAIKVLGLGGLNITVPFKERVMRHLDVVSDAAEAIGAVNTVYRKDRVFYGENTDADGFHQALLAHGFRPRGKKVLVIGAGGSARAVLYALASCGASDVVVANRTMSNARRLVRTFATSRTRMFPADLEILDDFDFLESRHLVVNCTPVGLDGGEFLDYAVEATAEDCLHFDLVYGEKPTPFVQLAQAAGRPCLDGKMMLVHQGAIAFKIFTGRKAPIDVMARAIGADKP